ncbi:MAG: hypothetical protein KAX49_13790 [Halanaerobiales bacterium]|nr:hypothetical protein [Halanaerobiales bacterium]
MDHITDIQFAQLKLHYDVGDILTNEELIEITHHIDNCDICKNRFKLEKYKFSSDRLELIQYLKQTHMELSKLLEISCDDTIPDLEMEQEFDNYMGRRAEELDVLEENG